MRRPLVTALVAVAAVGAFVGIEVLSGTSGGETGKPAPPLPASVLVPPRTTIADLAGKPALVNFWASWCHPCIQEAPALEQFARRFKGRAGIVGVDWTDGLDGAKAYVADHGWTFPSLRDPDGAAGQRYGITNLPVTFVLDAHGTIVRVLHGPQTFQSLSAAVRDAS